MRSLRDTGQIDICPLVLLVGANSSGKSTFLRSFPLLKQSLDVRKKGPLLWYGPEVDFGSFKEAVTSGKEKMCFEIRFSGYKAAKKTLRYREILLKKLYFEVTKYHKHDHVSSFSFELIDGQIISVNIDKDNARVFINNRDFSSEIEGVEVRALDSYGLIPNLVLFSGNDNSVSDIIAKKVSAFINEKTGVLVDPNELNKRIGVYASLLNKEDVIKSIRDLVPNYQKSDAESFFSTVYDFLTFRDLNEIIDSSNMLIRYKFGEVKYIKPLRASAERYYRVQNLSVNELDSDGHNLAMFLNDLYSEKRKKSEFQNWTEKNFGFTVEAEENNGQVSLQVLDNKNNKFVNIADTGAGYAQILPIIVKMWQTLSQKSRLWLGSGEVGQSTILAIEQPELHLHPNLQVKFAESLVTMLSAKRKGDDQVKAIVETHSKDIIARIGMCVERGLIASEDVVILLFDDDHNVRQARFDKNGILQDWPIGFFDPE